MFATVGSVVQDCVEDPRIDDVDQVADGGFEDKVALPIGLGTIGLTRIGGLPIRWGLEAQYYVSGGDDIAREANFRFFIAPVIANPFK